jgi:hypothetical protein
MRHLNLAAHDRVELSAGTVDPKVHYAYYEFDDVAIAQAIPNSDALKRLVAEFDRVWGDKVARSRDVVEVIQTIGA